MAKDALHYVRVDVTSQLATFLTIYYTHRSGMVTLQNVQKDELLDYSVE